MAWLDLDQYKKDEISHAAKWISGLLFSGLITAWRNVQLKKRQERMFDTHAKQVQQHLTSVQEDRVVQMIQDVKEAVDYQNKLVEERHKSNTTRFENNERRLDSLSGDIKQNRTETEGLRSEIRTTNTLLQTIIVNKVIP